jgi:hypothetical protein
MFRPMIHRILAFSTFALARVAPAVRAFLHESR